MVTLHHHNICSGRLPGPRGDRPAPATPASPAAPPFISCFWTSARRSRGYQVRPHRRDAGVKQQQRETPAWGGGEPSEEKESPESTEGRWRRVNAAGLFL
ncbi:unnamed protein product [Arctogadus glacialis]